MVPLSSFGVSQIRRKDDLELDKILWALTSWIFSSPEMQIA